MTAPRIFFLHNPKAGGSSLRSVFAALNNTGSIAPVFGNAPADYQSNREFVNNYRGYDLYAGHYGYDVYRAIGDGHLLVTNFRRSEEHTSELQSLMRISYAVFCLKQKKMT